MINIKNAIYNANTFTELCQIAENAEPKLSFWGGRYVEVKGYDGYLDIDDLAARTMQLIKDNPHFEEEERPAGRNLAKRVDYIYDESIAQVKSTCNLFTKILAFFRSLDFSGLCPLTPRCLTTETYWQWRGEDICYFEESTERYFNQFDNLYTSVQFEKTFGFRVIDENYNRTSYANSPSAGYWLPPTEKQLKSREEEKRRAALDPTWFADISLR